MIFVGRREEKVKQARETMLNSELLNIVLYTLWNTYPIHIHTFQSLYFDTIEGNGVSGNTKIAINFVNIWQARIIHTSEPRVREKYILRHMHGEWLEWTLVLQYANISQLIAYVVCMVYYLRKEMIMLYEIIRSIPDRYSFRSERSYGMTLYFIIRHSFLAYNPAYRVAKNFGRNVADFSYLPRVAVR